LAKTIQPHVGANIKRKGTGIATWEGRGAEETSDGLVFPLGFLYGEPCGLVSDIETRYNGPMIANFKDEGTEDVFNGVDSKASRKTCPPDLLSVAHRKLDMVNVAIKLDDLRIPPQNRLKALDRDRKGQHSIRINDQYRICFRWADGAAEDVEITDYH
jgi:toxin HigB-1